MHADPSNSPRRTDSDLSAWTTLSRHTLVEEIGRRFPAAAQPAPGGTPPRGGRQAALERLSTIDPATYSTTRNHVDGQVTRLSPWIRHGVVSIAEVRDRAIAISPTAEGATKLVSELAWRDYWRRVQATLGEGIRLPIESPAAVPRQAGADRVPEDVRRAATGMPCIDAFVRKLLTTGLLHNHERMWLASWMVHMRGVSWLAGADWFLEHLLDGDPASNHLSWQWVAGTFSSKPYVASRSTLEACTDGVHCHPCRLRGRCDLEGPPAAAAEQWFDGVATRPKVRIPPAPNWRPGDNRKPRRPLVWLTIDSASTSGPAARRHPGAPCLFVVDAAWLAEERPSRLRLAFLIECLADVAGVRIIVGDPLAVIPRILEDAGCDGISLADTPCPRVRRQAEALALQMPVDVSPWPPFVDDRDVTDLGRFSRYWEKVRRSALLLPDTCR